MPDRRTPPRKAAATRMPPAAAVKVAELAAWSKDSIVSRMLVQNTAGNVTLFAFDNGRGLSEHAAPFDALVLVLAGRARLTVGGKPIEAGAGQAVLMPAGIPHAVLAVRRFKMLLIMLRGKP